MFSNPHNHYGVSKGVRVRGQRSPDGNTMEDDRDQENRLRTTRVVQKTRQCNVSENGDANNTFLAKTFAVASYTGAVCERARHDAVAYFYTLPEMAVYRLSRKRGGRLLV